jgi:flavin-dependent dehydrogenase
MNPAVPRPKCDVAVIGAGPAGVLCSAVLHRAGLDVQVFEAQAFPRFVIGESLLPHCMDLLSDVGLLDAAAAQGYQEKFGALFLWEDCRQDFLFAEQFTKGWDYTWQVPRAHFDNVLATTLAARGVPIFFEHKVEAVSVDAEPRLTVTSKTGEATEVHARFIVDASGYGRVLPRLLDLHKPSDFPPRKACFTHVRGDQYTNTPDGRRIWVISNSADAWTWVIPFSNGVTSVGVVGAPEFFANFPGNPNEALRGIIASNKLSKDRLESLEFLFDAREITAYAVGVKRVYGDRFCLVGNATEFLDPVFSSGVTLAMESGHRAGTLIAQELAGTAVDWETDYAQYLASGTDVFRTYVEGWYDGTLAKIFRSPNPPEKFKRMICSVLAGYVWDRSNPFVAEHRRKLRQLAQLVGE